MLTEEGPRRVCLNMHCHVFVCPSSWCLADYQQPADLDLMRYSGAQRKRHLRILGAGWEDLIADFANLPSPEGNLSDLPIYALIGDIVAVDGNGGTTYRT
jgi:hypothetical protein